MIFENTRLRNSTNYEIFELIFCPQDASFMKTNDPESISIEGSFKQLRGWFINIHANIAIN